METFTHSRPVQFADTDAAGVVHFSRILCYVEEAEHCHLQKLGIPVGKENGWPRVKIESQFLAPLRFGDTAEVSLGISHHGETSISWQFTISTHGTPCCKGEMTCVHVNSQGNPVPIPSEWRDLL